MNANHHILSCMNGYPKRPLLFSPDDVQAKEFLHPLTQTIQYVPFGVFFLLAICRCHTGN